MAEYERVIPRDLFNEAKLLKCLGQLSLKIHDGVVWPIQLVHNKNEGFAIAQHAYSGDIYCANVSLNHKRGKSVKEIPLYSGLNSHLRYPLIFDIDFGEKEGFVFNDAGEFTGDFIDLMENL